MTSDCEKWVHQYKNNCRLEEKHLYEMPTCLQFSLSTYGMCFAGICNQRSDCIFNFISEI